MIRARFRVAVDDYRPIKWPLPHPYWCTGERGGHWALGRGAGLFRQVRLVVDRGMRRVGEVYAPTQADVRHALRWLVGLEDEPTREVGRG